MAALTASRLETHSMGDQVLYIVSFASVATDDTWTSGLAAGQVRSSWANSGLNSTTSGSEGVNVAESAGVFTFFCDDIAAHTDLTLFVLAASSYSNS